MEIIFTQEHLDQYEDFVKNGDEDALRNANRIKPINFGAQGDAFREIYDEYSAGRLSRRGVIEYLELEGYTSDEARYWLKRFDES